jgi:hypothetical protein
MPIYNDSRKSKYFNIIHTACFPSLIALFIFTLIFEVAFASVTLEVTPRRMQAGSWNQITYKFTVGDEGLEPGGGVRIELPVAYLETEPYFWDCPQTTMPEARGYVKCESSGSSGFEITLSGRREGIIECTVKGSPVKAGEVVTLTYQGIVQSFTWDCPVRAQWRKNAEENWTDAPDLSVFQFDPQDAVTLFTVAPADVEAGKPFELAAVLLDKFGNLAGGYRGTVTFESTDPKANLPAPYTFTESDAGLHVFANVKLNTAGFQKITSTDGNLVGKFHYSEVHETLPPYQRYFGETHFHTGTGTKNMGFTTTSAGGDHRGHFTNQRDAYTYVRDVMRHDFASASEHDPPVFDEVAWNLSNDIADEFYQRGRFTTFYGYEWTASATQGHHVILYNDRESKVLNHIDYPTKQDIYKAFDEQNKPVVMIPHIMWAQPDHGIWEDVNNKYRTVGEMYSLWNNRFLLQPADEPQRFELGIDNPWSFQYAWNKGHKIGVVGSTDNHTAHPGANNWTAYTQHAGGLAAALSKGNNRQGIWDSFRKRRTYATSGVRILLEFTADGHYMGEEYSTGNPPVFKVKAAGTNTIETVDLVKYDGQKYEVIHTVKPDAETCEFEFKDESFSGDSMYYVRVLQVDELWRSPWSLTTREMAWSSPVWINKK